jgi:hypothetical protein
VTPKLHVPEAVNAGGEGGSDTDGPSGNAKRLSHVDGYFEARSMNMSGYVAEGLRY